MSNAAKRSTAWKLVWFVVLWIAGVAAVGTIAILIRLLLPIAR